MAFGIERLQQTANRIESTVTALATTTLTALSASGEQRFGRLTTAISGTETRINTRIDSVNVRVDAVQADLRALKHATHALLEDERTRQEIAKLHTLLSEQKAEIAALRAETETRRRTLEPAETQPEPERVSAPDPRAGEAAPHTRSEPPSGSPDDVKLWKRHLDLLLASAGIASAKLTCHHDLWAFYVEKTAHEQHFRIPADIKDTGNGKVQVTLSGRTLIASLTALWELRGKSRASELANGDWALSNELYEAVAAIIESASRGRRTGEDGGLSVVIDSSLKPSPEATVTATSRGGGADDTGPEGGASDTGIATD
ncbi:hypothetical protein [Streptomyces sp. SBT349]|uniref:hypothetical protein n=1 Tax=Streptomyces sp. SBT349 TaxID=1580539 RepID=UPI00066D4748|nr:hypothetical protein [Streptomyces sp. SBT349]